MATVPIGLLQEADDLLFRKPLLHVQPPSSEGLDSKPICYSNAGGRRGQEITVCGDSGYTGVEQRAELRGVKAAFWIAEQPSRLLALELGQRRDAERWERFKASLRAKVEHPFRVVKRQFGYTKVRYRGLAKNTAQVLTLFALSNLWMARRKLLPATGSVRL